MSETISSNVLFHFTSSIDHIKSILRNGFFPRYCPEFTLDPADQKAVAGQKHPTWAIPMVCFCDLPLSLIRKHLEAYGNFGIGLTKQWGIDHGVAPVIYTHAKAKTRPSVSRLLTEAASVGSDQAATDMMYLAAYSKPFRGYEWRHGKFQEKDEPVQFYDEREWRYVPPTPRDAPLFLDWKRYKDEANRERLQEKLRQRNTLRVPPDAIMYLVLPFEEDEKNVLKLHRFLKRLYPRERDAILVTTTIMTDDCIKEDI